MKLVVAQLKKFNQWSISKEFSVARIFVIIANQATGIS